MTGRRQFLAGMLAVGLAPRPSWADAGQPAYLAAGLDAAGTYKLCGLSTRGAQVFAITLPGRGHAAAAHPHLPHAVAFARRPGVFALVIDCRSGAVLARLDSPPGHHFYGHGVFSADGRTLFTTENAFERGEGRIGVWDAANGYARIGDFASNGVGPHEMLRLPGQDTLVVANGGIETHPESGRAKLNLPMMRPNLSYLTPDGAVLETIEPTPEARLNSIRHLAVTPTGQVALAMQWQGALSEAPPLLALHQQGAPLRLCQFDAAGHRALRGYAGSVAFSGAGDLVGITSPIGGEMQVFSAKDGTALARQSLADTCGLAAAKDGFMATAGDGQIVLSNARQIQRLRLAPLKWDNHLVPVGLAQT